jgi:uncharacterized protein with HEPN domain
MLQREVQKLLWDILIAGEDILSFTEGMEYHDYLSDRIMQAAVECKFEIIGEALNAAIRLDSSIQTYIPDTPKIISFRNRLIHGYDTISPAVVWGILIEDLRNLMSVVGRMLNES